jgi:hypothetical protein
MKFQFILRWFAYGSLRVVFLRQNWTSSKQYQNKPKFDKWCDLTPNRLNVKFNWFRGGLLMVHQELCFCSKNWMILEISTNPSLSLSFVFFLFNILIWLETVTRWNITLFFFLDDADTKNKKIDADTKNKKIDANTEKLKGTLKNKNNIRIWPCFGA